MAAGSIVVDLLVKTGSFETDTARAEKRVRAFQKAVQDTGKQAAETGGLEALVKKLRGLDDALPISAFGRLGAVLGAGGPIAGAAIVLGAVAIAAKTLIGALDDLDEAAQGVGTTAVALDELRLGAKFSGVEAEQLTKALAALNSKAADAASGNKGAAAAFNALGINVKNARGELKPTEQLLGEISDKIKDFRDDAAKGALLADLFGQKVGPRLAAFLNQGSDALRVNTGLTKEAVDEAVRAQREIDKSTQSWEKLKNTLALFAAQGLNAITDFFKGIDNVDSSVKLAKLTTQIAVLRRERDAIAQNPLPNKQLRNTTQIDKQIADIQDQIKALHELDAAKEASDKNRAQAPSGKLNAEAQSFLETLKKQSDALGLSETAIQRIRAEELKVGPAAEPMIKKIELFNANLEISKILIKDIEEAQKRADEAIDFRSGLTDRIKDIENQTAQISLSEVAQQKFNAALEIQRQLKARIAELDKQGGGETDFAAVNAANAEAEAAIKRANAAIDAQELAKRSKATKLLDFGFGQELDDIRFATSLIGKTQEQVELLTAARQVDRREAQATFGLEGQALADTEAAYQRFREQVVGATQDQQNLAKSMQPFIESAKQFGETIASSFEDAIVEGKAFGDVLKQLEKDLLRILLRNFVTNPLGDAITNALRGIGGGIGSGGGGGSIDAGSGGLGANIASARRQPGFVNMNQKTGGDIHITNNVDARGATDPAAIDRALKASEQRSKAAFLETRARNPAYSQ